MSLLREIQDAAVDSRVNLPDLLRKCKILAVRLRNEEFQHWVDAELNGYSSGAQLPAYRVFHVESKGHFSGYVGRHLQNAPIPPSSLPERFQKMVSTHECVDPISALADLIQNKSASMFQVPWPADLIPLVGQDIYQDMSCLSAWKVITRGEIVGILDTVRTRILNFVLELEKEAPTAGETISPSGAVPKETVTHIFQTQIFGDVANFAAGSPGALQSSTVSVIKGNFDSLSSYLAKLGLDKDDISQLRTAVEEDANSFQGKTGMGKQTGDWLGKIITKAASGVLTVGTSVASNLIVKALAKYLGLPT